MFFSFLYMNNNATISMMLSRTKRQTKTLNKKNIEEHSLKISTTKNGLLRIPPQASRLLCCRVGKHTHTSLCTHKHRHTHTTHTQSCRELIAADGCPFELTGDHGSWRDDRSSSQLYTHARRCPHLPTIVHPFARPYISPNRQSRQWRNPEERLFYLIQLMLLFLF